MAEQPTIFTVVKIIPETEQMRLLSLHTLTKWSFIPGQVAILMIDEVGESYYAIASSPDDADIDVLVKDGKGVSAALFRMNQGDKIKGKGPTGKGFPAINYIGRDFIIAAVGSAISPMRGVIRYICTRRNQFGKISLIYGVRLPSDLPFRDEIKDWEKSGINVTLTISRPEGMNWRGKVGYVHLHFGEIVKQLNKPVALICGMRAMQDQSRNELIELGVVPGEILTNY
jgi:anaerobic sulfite reductase subunit B